VVFAFFERLRDQNLRSILARSSADDSRMRRSYTSDALGIYCRNSTIDIDGVDERRPKPLCPHRINTLQYTSLLIFFTHTFTATSSSVQLCFKIVYNILILPKFI